VTGLGLGFGGGGWTTAKKFNRKVFSAETRKNKELLFYPEEKKI